MKIALYLTSYRGLISCDVCEDQILREQADANGQKCTTRIQDGVAMTVPRLLVARYGAFGITLLETAFIYLPVRPAKQWVEPNHHALVEGYLFRYRRA